MKVAVVGAGISGLSAAHHLRKLFRERNVPLELVLFESADRAGGVFRTVRRDGMVLELGPDSFLSSKPWAVDLVRDLGLSDSLVGVAGGKSTFVYRDGKLQPLPDGFFLMAPSRLLPFLRSGVLSLRGRLRVLLEPFVARGGGGDESLSSFVERRLGTEALERIAQPLIGGIYMADPANLSLSATMPQFLEMERRSGSVLVHLLRNPPVSAGESGARYGLFLSPAQGMSAIIEKLRESARFSDERFRAEVSSLERSEGKWLVGSGGGREPFDAVVLSMRAGAAGGLLSDVDPCIGRELCGVSCVSSVVAVLVFDERKFRGLPDGAGIVIPAAEKMNLAACSIYSSKFPGKSGSGRVVIRCFLGGELNPEAAFWEEEKIKAVLREELERIFGFDNRCSQTHIARYPMSMPSFAVGHTERISAVVRGLSRHPGLALCGAAFAGVGIPDCVRSGMLAARKISEDAGFDLPEDRK